MYAALSCSRRASTTFAITISLAHVFFAKLHARGTQQPHIQRERACRYASCTCRHAAPRVAQIER